jgi:hypothetical protein
MIKNLISNLRDELSWLTYYPMIRQDHLMGRPRNVESISICSIGTIRGGIQACAPEYETFRWNEGVGFMALVSTHESFLWNEG